MGVTSIQVSALVENRVLTGSYDDTLCLWDTRAMKKPLHSVPIGGGVWRIKEHPSTPEYVAVAGMYNGFHIVRVSETPEVVESYMEHKSIAYGIDWIGSTNLLACASFYDNLLSLWQSKNFVWDDPIN
eukprot:c16272_g1_i3.p2 GENE.c16272_g1_i3~~c16272_g1_i3.p2  ORF type:complete len:128 (-),score=35.27 c16272_g1_i3:32-415(-)